MAPVPRGVSQAFALRPDGRARPDKVPFRAIIVVWEIRAPSLSSFLAAAHAPADSIADRASRPLFAPRTRSRGDGCDGLTCGSPRTRLPSSVR